MTGSRTFLWWRSGCSAFGIYGFGASPELAGMVAPDARRRGIGSALLELLCRYAASASIGSRCWSCRASRSRAAGAGSRGGTLDHSEHHLVLSGEPASGPCTSRRSAFARRPSRTPLVVAARAGFDGRGRMISAIAWSGRRSSSCAVPSSGRCFWNGATTRTRASSGSRSSRRCRAAGSVELRCGKPASSSARTARAASAWTWTSPTTVRWASTRRSASRPSPRRITSRCC